MIMKESLAVKIRRFIISLIIILIIILTGGIGYTVLENWSFLDSLFFTLVTLSTVGYSLPDGITYTTQVFTIILILSGITVVVYSLSTLTSFIVEGEMKNALEVRKRMKKIEAMKNHYIVVGAGKTGFFVCQNMIKENKDFILLDKSEEKIYQFIQEINNEDILYIVGDAKNENVLLDAGIERANSVILTLPSDVDNLFCCFNC